MWESMPSNPMDMRSIYTKSNIVQYSTCTRGLHPAECLLHAHHQIAAAAAVLGGPVLVACNDVLHHLHPRLQSTSSSWLHFAVRRSSFQSCSCYLVQAQLRSVHCLGLGLSCGTQLGLNHPLAELPWLAGSPCELRPLCIWKCLGCWRIPWSESW